MAKEERQSTKENLRLFLLDSLFQQDRFYTKDELIAKTQVSIPTLDRDLRRLRDDYNAPLESTVKNTALTIIQADYLSCLQCLFPNRICRLMQ